MGAILHANRQEAKAAKEAAKAKKELLASKPSSAALSRRGGLAAMQSRKSIRPSMRGEGLGAPGRGGMSGRGLGPSAKYVYVPLLCFQVLRWVCGVGG